MTSAQGAWWQDAATLQRYVGDLVAAEFIRLRPGSNPRRLPARPWALDFALDADGLGADSLELMALATALTESLHVRESGLEDLLLAYRTFGAWCDTARRSLEQFDQRVGFYTSGSTGRAQLHPHELDDLAHEAHAIAALVTPRQRVLSFVPAHHLYGFIFTVLVPHAMRREDCTSGDHESSLPVIDMRDTSPVAIAKHLLPGDLVVATPALWQLIERGLHELPPNVVGTTSTAPCPSDLAEALTRRGALAHLVHVYGSTETSGVAWRLNTDPTYELFSFCTRADTKTIERRGRRMTLPDIAQWQDDSRFTLGGRIDHVVQVGGVNVSLDEVRKKLAGIDGVREVAVRRMRPEEGERLKAFIVPSEPDSGIDGLRDRIAQWVDQNLPFAERPRSIEFGQSLPRSAMGKLTDWSVKLSESLA